MDFYDCQLAKMKKNIYIKKMMFSKVWVDFNDCQTTKRDSMLIIALKTIDFPSPFPKFHVKQVMGIYIFNYCLDIGGQLFLALGKTNQ